MYLLITARWHPDVRTNAVIAALLSLFSLAVSSALSAGCAGCAGRAVLNLLLYES
jgi:hypothetical protein